jgi:hypothetical protein
MIVKDKKINKGLDLRRRNQRNSSNICKRCFEDNYLTILKTRFSTNLLEDAKRDQVGNQTYLDAFFDGF